MKLIKMLGAVLLSCTALMSVGTNAQQTVPVSCSWGAPIIESPRNQPWKVFTSKCNESNGTLVATQSIRRYTQTGVMLDCFLTPSPGFSYTGTCTSPNFFKTIVVDPPIVTVPVSCSWSLAFTESPPNQPWRIFTSKCNESNGTLVATQSIRRYTQTGVMLDCFLTPSPGFSYTGTCTSPSFSKILLPTCANAGKDLGFFCANQMNSINVPLVCGSNCSLGGTFSGTSANCPSRENPSIKAFCK